MTLTDGTTSITVNYADEQYETILEKTSTRTAGGNIRSTTGGERFRISVRVRVTESECRSIMALLTNNAETYYYTPDTDFSTLYPDLSFPIAADISEIKREWNNNTVIYLNFTVEALGYV
jgi:hypothetical protein